MVRDQIMGFRKTPVMKKQSRDTGDGPRLEIALKQYMGRSVGPPLAGRTVVVQCLHVGSFQWWTRGLLLCTFRSFALMYCSVYPVFLESMNVVLEGTQAGLHCPLRGTFYVDICVNHCLPITHTICENRGVHKCTWHQAALGRRSIIDFLIVSSDLPLYSTCVCFIRSVAACLNKKGIELSTDHHLIVS